MVPSASLSIATSIETEDRQHLFSVLPHAWADSTKEMYRSGLLAFHTFCDFKSIPEMERVPVTGDILSSFISHLAGTYALLTVVNYMSAVQAWHAIHDLNWSINEKETELLYKAAWNLVLPTPKYPTQEPYTLSIIATIKEHLDLTLPLHVAVFACLTMTCFAAACTREFTIPNLKAFDPARHIT
jgi:hypothetical protein